MEQSAADVGFKLLDQYLLLDEHLTNDITDRYDAYQEAFLENR